MSNFLLQLSLLSFLFASCTTNHTKDLVKLSKDEIIENTINNLGKTPPIPPVYKNQEGDEISLDSIQKLSPLSYGYDIYADTNQVIKLVVIREVTSEDSIFYNTINNRIKEVLRPEVEIVDIACNEITEILNEVMILDQENRKGGMIDEDIDFHNLTKVVSILEHCGMPSSEEVGKEVITTIWLVIQHADAYYRSKYFLLLKEAARKGDLNNAQIALMEDRMYMDNNVPQRYGSQLTFNSTTQKMELYEVENMENVNELRASVGLEPLEDYVKQFGIEL